MQNEIYNCTQPSDEMKLRSALIDKEKKNLEKFSMTHQTDKKLLNSFKEARRALELRSLQTIKRNSSHKVIMLPKNSLEDPLENATYKDPKKRINMSPVYY